MGMKSKLTLAIVIVIAFLFAFGIFLIWLFSVNKKPAFVIKGWNSSFETWLSWIGNDAPLSKQMGPLLISPNISSGLVWTVSGQNVILSPLTSPISLNQVWYFYSGGTQQQGTDQWPAYLGTSKNQIITINENNIGVADFDPNESYLAFNQLSSQTCKDLVYLTLNDSIYYIDSTPQSAGENVVVFSAQSSDDCSGATNLFFATLE